MQPVISKISLNQERYLIAEEFTNTNYTLTSSYRIKGELDHLKLLECFQKVVDSNDALRIKFSKNSNSEVHQLLHPNNQVEFDYQTLENPTHTQIKDVISRYFYTKNVIFDVFPTKGQLIKLSDTEHILTIASHHSLMDGLSIAVLLMQVAKVWNQGKPNLTSAGHYLEILSENGLLDIGQEKLNSLKGYWRNYLDNANPALIPTDFRLLNVNDDEKAKVKRLISVAMLEKVDAFSKQHDFSRFHIFYLAYNLLIAKQSGGTDVVTSFESHGRQNLKNASRAIGLFSTALVLRLKLDNASTIGELLDAIKDDAEQSIAHQHYPYHHIIKDAKFSPRYAFNWFPRYVPPQLDGLEITIEPVLNLQSSFDLNLHCYTQDEGISLELLYNPDLFTLSRMETLLEQIENIIEQLISNVDQTVAAIKLITKDQHMHLPDVGQRFAAKINKNIDEDFYLQVNQKPFNTAIDYQNEQWTYQETNDICEKLAQLILNKGIGTGNKVAILGLRCPSMIMAVLATLKCGSSFAILNAAYPAAMLKKYCDTLNPDLLIVCDNDFTKNHIDFLPSVDAKLLQISQKIRDNDEIFSALNGSTGFIRNRVNPSDVAYYLFTSGTTDQPKCIATSHAPLVHFINWQTSQFKISSDDRFTLLSGVSHDPVLRDIFTPLSVGASILIPTEQTVFNPELLYRWLLVTKPTICHITPAMSKLIHNGFQNSEQILSLRLIFSGGDRLEGHHVKDMMTIAPNATIVNFYGASETPQAMAYHQIQSSSLCEIIPIGQPIADTQILVLNEQRQPVGLYEVGQLAVRTKYLSVGYVANNDSNANRNNAYLNDIFSDDPEIKIYLTGDNGFFRTDGSAIFLGRNDDEIKIRGFRINLNVINHHLQSIPGIEDAFTFVIDDIYDNSDKKRLVAYIIKEKDTALTIDDLRAALLAQLPSYMLPSQFVFVEQLPLLPNGKVDRKKIISNYLDNEKDNSSKLIAGRNEAENNLIYSWAKILNINPRKISVKDSFTTLDGDSLSFIQASLVLDREIGIVPENWQSLSIEKLAQIRYQAQSKLDFHTEVLFRAIAIILVVIGHFWIGDTNQQVEELFVNATSALLLIAGFTFANFPMKSIQYKNNISPIVKTIIRIAVPTFLVTLVHVIYRSDYSISKLLFFDNFHWASSPYWFIEVLLQTLLLLGVIFTFKKVRAYAIRSPYAFGLNMLVITSLIGFLTPYVWNPEELNMLQLPHLKSWLFFFGWCIFFIQDNKQKISMSILGVILPVIILGQFSLLTSVCTLLLIYLPKIHITKNKLTNSFHIFIYSVASASLYIYITHIQFRSLLHAVGIDQSVLLDIAVGIAGGVLVHYIWHSLIASTASKVVSNMSSKLTWVMNRLKIGMPS